MHHRLLGLLRKARITRSAHLQMPNLQSKTGAASKRRSGLGLGIMRALDQKLYFRLTWILRAPEEL